MNGPSLPQVPLSDLTSFEEQSPPKPLIQTDGDVLAWQNSECYSHLLLYIQRLGESVVGTELGHVSVRSLEDGPIRSLLVFLEELDSWISDIPPQVSPQRYGNLAFRDWGHRLEQRYETMLKALLPGSLHKTIPFLQPYVLTSFGSFVRIDYGSGHELSFVVFLLCLHKIGFLPCETEVERSVVLDVFVKYLNVCWNLQDAYKLEPAGSHGVWGLDDYSFLGYIWGSAQLRGKSRQPVVPSSSSHFSSDKPGTSPSVVLQRPLPDPPTDLYALSILRINAIKTGPFHEHSPQLYSIASSVPVWRKVNTGLMKMYEAEVLSKRVVVQHLPLGEPLMPFSKFYDSQIPVASAPFRSSHPTQMPLHSIPTSVPRGPTNLLPPLRPRPRATVDMSIPGLTSSFATSSGGARFTVSRAAGRGDIPGAMGGREVASPLGDMGPPPVPAKLRCSPSSAAQGEKSDAPGEPSGR
ncbi:Serine/threonine-protein phosphatase 2A activator 1 [Ceratobasidium sp. UAMH 11750]|nr:Serine/threonine-protein phosphatase 2A activator 1 [Ceratobasidium sp. UAMH 11750]